MTLQGIDVSNIGQGSGINWSAVKAAGITFAFAKATEGNYFQDPAFHANRQGAHDNGIILIPYHFAANIDPVVEADYFANFVGPLQADESVVLDWETGGDAPGFTLPFLNECKARFGVVGGVYLNNYYLTNFDWSHVQQANYWLWYARYNGLQNDSPGSWLCAFKQYSDSGTVPGISRAVDLDVFYGDLTQLQAYCISAAPTPPPPPPPPPPRPHPPVYAWPFPANQYVGDINGPAASHGGYYPNERWFIKNVQQWLVYKGCVPGVDPNSWAYTGWCDGLFQAPYSTNAAIAWHNQYYPGQPFPDEIWRDDYVRLATP